MTVEAVDPDTIEQQRFDVVLHKLCRHFALAPTDPGVARELNAVSAYFATHRTAACRGPMGAVFFLLCC